MKKLVSVLLAVLLVVSAMPMAFAATPQATAAADALHELGLFNGTGVNPDGSPRFELDRAPSRHDSVTMLVRLLGKETEAKKANLPHPYKDVASWASPYVGYAHKNGLTNGMSPTSFGGQRAVTAPQYITFILRALGYQSDKDFQWNKSFELSDRLGITQGQYNATSKFTRGDVALVSYNALNTKPKGSNKTLLQTLQDSGAVPKPTPAPTPTVTPTPEPPVKVESIVLSETDVEMTTGETLTLTPSITPADAQVDLTWKSSVPSVASVDSNGTVTAVGEGTTYVTASFGSVSASCTVRVKAPLAFSVPVIGHEYGPMTITRYYSSDRIWAVNEITSLVFTKIEDSGDDYKVYASMQGTVTGDDSADFRLYFYDADGRVLGNEWFTERVTEGVPYNILKYKYIEKDIMDNAVSIKFFSYSNNEAEGGNTPPATPTPTPDTSPTAQPTPTAPPTPGNRLQQLVNYISTHGTLNEDGNREVKYSYEDTVSTIEYQKSENRLYFFSASSTGTSAGGVGMYHDLSAGSAARPIVFIFRTSVSSSDLIMAASLNPATYTKNTKLTFVKRSGPTISNTAAQNAANACTQLGVITWQLHLMDMGFSLTDLGGFQAYLASLG